MHDAATEAADGLMRTFARSSGLSGDDPPRRYLWTDAHAVCNFLSLEALTGDPAYRRLALTLVDQVHGTLGRHRADGAASGWLSGLDDAEARRHPTVGGLRIGKPLPERLPHEPYDDALEWDRDGQYYHYLTKWMHALRQVAGATGERRYLIWARELAQTAYQRFRAPTGTPRLYWKMSVDLSRPLVPASGQHDPLDGLITALSLGEPGDADGAALDDVTAGLAAMLSHARFATGDPLGLGGLLFDAGRVAQLGRHAGTDLGGLLGELLEAAALGLAAYERSRPWQAPGAGRLAFRELGLCIGFASLKTVSPVPHRPDLDARAAAISARASLAETLVRFWSEPEQHRTAAWQAHADINAVMLATSLVPDGFVRLQKLTFGPQPAGDPGGQDH